MAENDQMSPNPAIIYNLAIHLERLDNHLDQTNPSVQKTVSLLGEIEPMSNVTGFEKVGDRANRWREGLLNKYDMKNALGLTNSLNSSDVDDLEENVQAWKFRSGDAVSEIFSISPDTTLPAQELGQGAEAFLDLPESILRKHSDVVSDLDEACVCILIESYTAAEFMALRAAESTLRHWHSTELDEEKDYGGWYNAIRDVTGEEINQGPKELSLLDYLRNRRNEVAHPDRHSTQSDAERTIQNVFEVVEKLIIDIGEDSD